MMGLLKKISTKGTASVELIGVAEKAPTAKAEAWVPWAEKQEVV